MLAPPKNRQTVEIYGQQYCMLGKSSPDHIMQIALYVDEKMKEVASGNPRLDSTRLAVLSAVNIADEYLQLKTEYDELVTLIEEESL